MVPLTHESATEALAQSSASLRAAGVTGVWLYTDGMAWTNEYVVLVSEQATLIETVTATDGRTINATRLRAGAKDALLDAIRDLDLQGMHLEVRAQDALSSAHSVQMVWPASAMIAAAEAEIATLQARIAALKPLDH